MGNCLGNQPSPSAHIEEMPVAFLFTFTDEDSEAWEAKSCASHRQVEKVTECDLSASLTGSKASVCTRRAHAPRGRSQPQVTFPPWVSISVCEIGALISPRVP